MINDTFSNTGMEKAENAKEASYDIQTVKNKGKHAKASVSEAEPTRAVNVPLPESIYRKLTMLKLNMPGESLKSIAARFIMEGLEKMEQKA